MNNNKKTIQGIKEEKGTYRGKVISIVKKVSAIALAFGLVVAAPQAIEMYNQWANGKTLTKIENMINKGENKTQEKSTVLSEFKTIAAEYKKALENDEKEKKEELDAKVEDEKYYEKLTYEINDAIIEKLGYDPEKARIILGRDGVYLIDKEKANDGSIFTNIGNVSESVKIRDEEGKIIQIPSELKVIYTKSAEGLSKDDKGVVGTLNQALRLMKVNEFENDKELSKGNYEIEK